MNIKSGIVQEVIPLGSPTRWRESLKGINHSFAHTWESCYAMHLTTGDPTYLYTLKNGDKKVVCPISERSFQNFTDLYTPYGFNGFAGNAELPGTAQLWEDFARQRGYICGYIGLNPLWEKQSYYSLNDIHHTNKLYVVDLRLPVDQLCSNLSHSRRRNLRGYEELKTSFIFDKNVLKDFFLKNYHDFFIKKNASHTYNFTKETLSTLMDSQKVWAVGIHDKAEVLAISVFGYTEFSAEYLFNISAEKGRSKAAPLMWAAINYFKGLGIPYLNMGGGVKPGDGIADFKKRFGGMELPLMCLKQVYRQDTYDRLCRNQKSNPENREGYFPAYRKVKRIDESGVENQPIIKTQAYVY